MFLHFIQFVYKYFDSFCHQHHEYGVVQSKILNMYTVENVSMPPAPDLLMKTMLMGRQHQRTILLVITSDYRLLPCLEYLRDVGHYKVILAKK